MTRYLDDPAHPDNRPDPPTTDLFLPWDKSRSALAHRAVLVSWCRANELPVEDIPEGRKIEIHDGLISYSRYMTASHAAPPVRTAQSPLLVAPAGLITSPEALHCGHILVSPSPVADAPPIVHVCDQHTSPVDGTHPGDHAGDPGDRRSAEQLGWEPSGNWRADTSPGFRMSWPNEHPGDQAYHRGLPDATGLHPIAAHALVLAQLTHERWRQPGLNRAGLIIAGGPHSVGLFQLAERHGPRDTRHAGIVCDHDFVSATGLTDWPCADYRDAAAGIVHFPAVAR